MPATKPNARRLGASLRSRVSLLMDIKDSRKAIDPLEAIALLLQRDDRAAHQARGLRMQTLRQRWSPAFLGPGANAPRAQEG
eukprot:2699375-Alexandrium_andersonii.AAC.1